MNRDPAVCWCHAQYGLTVPAASPGEPCRACAQRSPSACKRVHEETEGGVSWSARMFDAMQAQATRKAAA